MITIGRYKFSITHQINVGNAASFVMWVMLMGFQHSG